MKVAMVWVIFFIAITIFLGNANAQPSPHKPTFSVLVLYENGGHHLAYTNTAIPWLNQLAADSNFSINYIQNTNTIDDELLKKYQLFIQLDYPPYGWKEQAVQAFQRYIAEGRGGWIAAFIMQPYWGNLMAFRCGNGFLFLWVILYIKITSQHLLLLQ